MKRGGRLLFTDPVVITGPVSFQELAVRSSIGYFLYSPPGEDERLLGQAGFKLLLTEDVTENMAAVSKRWHDARLRRKRDLIRAGGQETFLGLQRFFSLVHKVASEHRLSRFVFLAEKVETA